MKSPVDPIDYAHLQTHQEDGVSKASSFEPNVHALKILKGLKKRRELRSFTDPAGTFDFIREARSGGMYVDTERSE